MRHFVTVFVHSSHDLSVATASPATKHSLRRPLHGRTRNSEFFLTSDRTTAGGRSALVVAARSAARPRDDSHGRCDWLGEYDSITDEHLAADLDSHRAGAALACADVLYSRRAGPTAEILRRLDDVRHRYPGCGLAAAPVGSDAWAVSYGRGGSAVIPVRGISPHDSLIASCLHAWLVAGHLPGVLEDLRKALQVSEGPDLH